MHSTAWSGLILLHVGLLLLLHLWMLLHLLHLPLLLQLLHLLLLLLHLLLLQLLLLQLLLLQLLHLLLLQLMLLQLLLLHLHLLHLQSHGLSKLRIVKMSSVALSNPSSPSLFPGFELPAARLQEVGWQLTKQTRAAPLELWAWLMLVMAAIQSLVPALCM